MVAKAPLKEEENNSKKRAFNELLKGNNIGIVLDPNATAQEKYLGLRRIQEEMQLEGAEVDPRERTPTKESAVNVSHLSARQSSATAPLQEQVEALQISAATEGLSLVEQT